MKNGYFDEFYITDGGCETSIIYLYKTNIPEFAAFTLFNDKQNEELVLKPYYKSFMDLCVKYKVNFIFDIPTWRANLEWGEKLGIKKEDLKSLNIKAVEFAKNLALEYTHTINRIIISGNIGPRRDGYQVTDMMSSDEAQNFHSFQIEIFKRSGVEMITAMTINYINEGLGITLSCMKNNIPVVIGFTIKKDIYLPSNETIEEFITIIDEKTNSYPKHYMINCTHPSYFIDGLSKLKPKILNRIRCFRCNSSDKSHEELNNLIELDVGDIKKLGEYHSKLNNLLVSNGGKIDVIGGCCGTDSSHIEEIIVNILKN